jgi:hypothetical protein
LRTDRANSALFADVIWSSRATRRRRIGRGEPDRKPARHKQSLCRDYKL